MLFLQKDILRLETIRSNESSFRTVITTRHGRKLFMLLEINGNICTIKECFYIDRNQGKKGDARFSAKPKKLRTLEISINNLLSVIETELDKKFYGIEFIKSKQDVLSLDEYIQFKEKNSHKKYNFLIFIGKGERYNNLPIVLKTRLKTKLHRAVYIELAYYGNGKGVVKQCYYYDRKYIRQGIKIMPPQLISCFFPYTNEDILNLINYEICCDFTHIIVTDGIDLNFSNMPLCGSV